MNNNRNIKIQITFALLTLMLTTLINAAPIGFGFNYQGSLNENGLPVDSPRVFTFSLYDAPTDGNQVGPTITLGGAVPPFPTETGITVSNGLFNASNLDFGDVYMGDELWLNITVKAPRPVTCGGGAPFPPCPVAETLSPRQKIHAVPYAVQSEFVAGNTTSPWIESGSNVSYDGTVGIGGTTIANVDLYIDSNTGRSPLLARVNNVPKLSVNTNGGTTLGFLLETPPVDGLLVSGPAVIGRNSTASVFNSEGLLSIGELDADHLTFDGDDIQARNGSSNDPDTLFLNINGGNVTIASAGTTTLVRGLLKTNGGIDVKAKITSTDSGNADMKAYVYGRAFSTGVKVTSQSSDGFTVSKTSTGLYRIVFTDNTINQNYIVTSSTNSSTAKFTSTVIGTDGFDLHVWNTSGNHTDHSFQFVVYRK